VFVPLESINSAATVKEPPKQESKPEPDKTPETNGHIRLEPHHNLTGFCDVEGTRYALGGVYIDTKRQKAVATNGRMLAVVPLEANGKAFIAPATLFKKLRIAGKTKRRKGGAFISLDNSTVVMSDDRGLSVSMREIEGRFPDWHKVTQGLAEPKSVVTLNAGMLKSICEHAVVCSKAMKGADPTIELTVRGDEDAVSIRAIPNNVEMASYLIMPVKSC
jgi:hypothetical protein